MKYLVAEAKDLNEVTTYLESWGEVVESAPTHKGPGKVAAMITASDEDVSFVSGRLHSGLMGGRIFETEAEARDLYDWLIEE